MMTLEARRWTLQPELVASQLPLIRASELCHHLDLLQRTASDHPGSVTSAFLISKMYVSEIYSATSLYDLSIKRYTSEPFFHVHRFDFLPPVFLSLYST